MNFICSMTNLVVEFICNSSYVIFICSYVIFICNRKCICNVYCNDITESESCGWALHVHIDIITSNVYMYTYRHYNVYMDMQCPHVIGLTLIFLMKFIRNQ